MIHSFLDGSPSQPPSSSGAHVRKTLLATTTGEVGGCSGSRTPTCKGLDHPFDPAQQGAFAVWTIFSGPKLVRQRLWYVLSCLWGSANKRSLAAYWEE